MKSFFADSFGRWLLIISLFVIIATILLGFFLDKRGFLGNILAEIAGVAVGVLVTILIVDQFSQHQRQKRWEKVRNLTYLAIANHLCDLVTEIFTYFPIQDHRAMTAIIEGRNRPNPNTINAIENLISQLKKLPDEVTPEKSTSVVAIEFHEKIKWDLDQIRNVLIPRIIQSPDDHNFINKLTEFDNCTRDLYNSILIHKEAVTHSVFPNVINLVEKAKIVYNELLSKWKPQ